MSNPYCKILDDYRELILNSELFLSIQFPFRVRGMVRGGGGGGHCALQTHFLVIFVSLAYSFVPKDP